MPARLPPLIVAVNAEAGTPQNLGNWMSQVPKTTQSNSITLPGTHQTATFNFFSTDFNTNDAVYKQVGDQLANINEAWAGGIVCRFSQNKSLSLTKQMEAGVRYMDLRFDYDPNGDTFRAFHLQWGQSALTLLSEIHAFLITHPSEVMVLEISHLYTETTSARKSAFRNAIITIFGELLYMSRDGSFSVSLGDLREARKRVIILSDDTGLNRSGEIWDSSIYIVTTYANTPDAEIMFDANVHYLELYRLHVASGSPALFKL